MNAAPIVVEQEFNAPIVVVWKAITDKDQMRQWFFEPMTDFKPEVGFETQFTVRCEDQDYPHLWKVTDVVPERRIAYEWRYGGYAGNSLVMWELSETPNGTKLKLTHEGHESFPQDNPVFSRESGQAGWNYFVHESLKAFVDQSMQNVDVLITLIRDGRHDEALAVLNTSPRLAIAHSDQAGQLHDASPLHWAGHRNAVQLCERLIQLGADVNDSASDWWLTPLAWAADAGSADTVELLLKHGADVNQDAVVGTTALHAVAMGGSSRGSADPDAYRRTAEILIAYGADVNRRATRDRTQSPLDDALANKNDHVAAVLRKHGAQVSSLPE